ncbi:pentatricopeptide repeat-containing protein At1g33350 [Malania oleifera]|uniref:pentatricopeptide repeat-containing protein At1g33350 n=1 Tax=Malania oleifera TaxID=397392 RepID=UPI0025ADD063|nr:pentatricopeptide repeat-containing protein At1g33350 [Malania oleifera]
MPAVPGQLNLNQHVLNVLKNCNHLNQLKQLQAFLIALGHGQTQFFAFKLVRFCTFALAHLEYARSIFDHLNSPNVFLYTAMITAYVSQSNNRSAFILYRDMVRQGRPRPNHFIYPYVLKSCPEISQTRGTESVHAQIVKWGFSRYPVVQTALVDSYSWSCSNLGAARELFDDMSDRNVVSWTAMISGYCRHGEMGNAILLFEKMPERDTPSWNAVIAGCAQNGLFSDAILLFKRMSILSDGGHHQGNRPNQVTVVCALSACGHCGMLQLGKCIHGYIYRNALGHDSFISNALVDMYGKCGSLKEARRVFDNTTKRSLTSWNSMINCLALHGQSQGAIKVFEEMLRNEDDVKLDGVTFVGLLNACTHGGLVEKGQFYFDLMTQTYEIQPQMEHYGSFIDLLGRAGRFEEAMEIVNRMEIEPDEVIWGSLLNGCKIHGRTDLAEFVVKKLIEIDPNNGGYGIMLANIYGELGKWDKVRELRKLLKEQNARKTPGCSWIEVNNQVHQFYSVDNMHPRTEEIYNILEVLTTLY